MGGKTKFSKNSEEKIEEIIIISHYESNYHKINLINEVLKNVRLKKV